MADNRMFTLKVITPERVFYEGEVSMVEFNATEGEVGIYKDHIPMTLIIKPGILAITETDGIKYAALHAGFAEILPDSTTILAEVIEWPEEIDEERAETAKERAEERLRKANIMTETDTARAATALERAIARITIISK